MIELEQVSIEIQGKQLLQNVTQRFRNGREDGTIYLIIGEKGTGKTALLETIAGARVPDTGTVRVGGYDMNRSGKQSKNARRLIGYVPQTRPLPNDVTVWEYLKCIAEARGMKGEDTILEITAVCRETGLAEQREMCIGRLPEKIKRRVLLAQALLGRSEYILLDEPAEGLNETQTRELYDIIDAVGRGRTVVLAGRPSEALETLAWETDAIVLVPEQGTWTERAPDTVTASEEARPEERA